MILCHYAKIGIAIVFPVLDIFLFWTYAKILPSRNPGVLFPNHDLSTWMLICPVFEEVLVVRLANGYPFL